jgi:hypothetical protein
LATLSGEYGVDLSGLDIRDQHFLADLAFKRSRLRIYEMAVAYRMSQQSEPTWLKWENSIMDLFKTGEELEQDVSAAWDQLRFEAKKRGW